MTIKTKLIHFKIFLFGDKELMEKGKMLPCRKCDNMFKSYGHYGEWSYVYDSQCDNCRRQG